MSRRAVLARWLLSFVLIGVAGWVFLNRQLVYDQLVVWQYKPSDAILSIVDRAQLTEKAKFSFYASQPSLSDRAEFNAHCESQEKQSVILGCYVRQQIYVYNVTDSRLDGIREVTAAHEMLHAAYERLSQDEKTRVNALIEAEMAKKHDKKLQERLALYAKTEPGERDNELHSILGTEAASLGPALEQYYSQYFIHRSVITGLAAKYEGVFKSLESQQNSLVAELTALAQEVRSDIATYNAAITSLNSDIESFNARASTTGGFSSQSEFAAVRNELVVRQQALEAERTSINAKIALYEQKRAQLEALNLQAKDLQNSIDSRLSPVPSI